MESDKLKRILFPAAAFLLGVAIQAGADSGFAIGVLLQQGGAAKGFAPTVNFRNSSISSAAGVATVDITGTGAGGSGASSAEFFVNCGGTAFSQCGLEMEHNGTLYNGWFDNLQATPISANFPAIFDAFDLYDNTDGVDRLESLNGASAPLFLQPQDGAVCTGSIRACTQPVTLGSGFSNFDPTLLASESLTNPNLTSGTSWTATNDCSLVSNNATCTFSAGTASTIQQASGTLAIIGHANRAYKFVYTVSGLSGAPTAALTSAFANISASTPVNLDMAAGSHTLYFQTNSNPGNFVIQTTLAAGQAFTLGTFSLKEIIGGDHYLGGRVIMGNCATGASPALCSAYASGAVAIPTGTNPTLVVDTSIISANSRILLTLDDTLTISGTTCNTTGATLAIVPYVSARNSGASFTIGYTGTIATNPVCVSYMVIN